MLPNRSGIRIRPWESSPDTATFISNLDNVVVGAFSLVVDSSDLGLPSDREFRDELGAIRGDGKLVCELSSQAIAPRYRRSPIATELMRMAFAHALHVGCTDLICAVSPHKGSTNFYTFIGFEQISEVKSYSKTIDDPVTIMRLPDCQHRWTDTPSKGDYMDLFWRDFFVNENRYLEEIDLWNLAAESMYEDLLELVSLFGRCEDLFIDSSPAERRAIARRLGDAYDPSCIAALARRDGTADKSRQINIETPGRHFYFEKPSYLLNNREIGETSSLPELSPVARRQRTPRPSRPLPAISAKSDRAPMHSRPPRNSRPLRAQQPLNRRQSVPPRPIQPSMGVAPFGPAPSWIPEPAKTNPEEVM